MSGQLDEFLKAGGEAAPAAEAPVESTPEPVAAEPATPAPQPAKPEADDDGEPPKPLEGEDAVPFRAFEKERHQRRDWKEKAVRAETERDHAAKERDDLRRQLEDAKRAPPAAAPQHAPQLQPVAQIEPPNPAADPAGYAAFVAQQAEAKVWTAQMHGHLNASERALRAVIGKEAVDAMVAEVKPEFERNPALHREFLAQDDPYGWLHQKLTVVRLAREVTTDPEAYKAKLRAEWEAERGGAAAPVVPRSPAAGLPPSLASARSVAARSAPAWTGPPAMDEILAQRRK